MIYYFVFDKREIALLHLFFFQAEDGIRDGHVTGVQTCALPICLLLEAVRLGGQTAARASGRTTAAAEECEEAIARRVPPERALLRVEEVHQGGAERHEPQRAHACISPFRSRDGPRCTQPGRARKREAF